MDSDGFVRARPRVVESARRADAAVATLLAGQEVEVEAKEEGAPPPSPQLPPPPAAESKPLRGFDDHYLYPFVKSIAAFRNTTVAALVGPTVLFDDDRTIKQVLQSMSEKMYGHTIEAFTIVRNIAKDFKHVELRELVTSDVTQTMFAKLVALRMRYTDVFYKTTGYELNRAAGDLKKEHCAIVLFFRRLKVSFGGKILPADAAPPVQKYVALPYGDAVWRHNAARF